jgi:hypothetical protein
MKTFKEIAKWLAANCGKRVTAPLTSTDVTALTASVALCPLISYVGAPKELFAAYGAIVSAMQPRCRWMAYHAIAMELDWSHRSMIWTVAGLAEGDKPSGLCAFEAGGCGRDLSKEAA